MKLNVNNVIVPAALILLSCQIAPVSAQSLSDAVGTQSHTFAPPAPPAPPPAAPEAQWTRHHSDAGSQDSTSSHKHSSDKHREARAQQIADSNTSTSSQTDSGQSNSSSNSYNTANAASATATTGATTVTETPKLSHAQLMARHHARLLALRAAHRRARLSALNGFDQVSGKPATDLDSLTRDGSATTTASSAVATHELTLGEVIARWIGSLILVLGIAYGAMTVMRKRGIGIPPTNAIPDVIAEGEIDDSVFGLRLQSGGTATIDQFQKAIQQAQARQTVELPSTSGVQTINHSIEGLEVLGSQELPGTAHTLYKIRIGERILLLGGSLSGSLTALTEWDVETKPETDQRFESVLNQMTMSVTPPIAIAAAAAPIATPHLGGGSQADALRTATQRLSRSARRMAEAGRATSEAS